MRDERKNEVDFAGRGRGWEVGGDKMIDNNPVDIE